MELSPSLHASDGTKERAIVDLCELAEGCRTGPSYMEGRWILHTQESDRANTRNLRTSKVGGRKVSLIRSNDESTFSPYSLEEVLQQVIVDKDKKM
jgi:hypothetical protein